MNIKSKRLNPCIEEVEELEQIEKELSILLQVDKKNWVKIYELMKAVEAESLWANVHHSFTEWVRYLAVSNSIHESILWKRKKQGKIYEEYEKRAKQQDKSVPCMEDLKVSPDNFELIDKIAQSNEQIRDELMDKLLKNEIQRRDLKRAWDTVRTEKEAKNQKARKINAYDKLEINAETQQIHQSALKAVDIILALKTPLWLQNSFSVIGNSKNDKRVYSQFAEFAVYTGTSRHSRRIDVMIMENMTCEFNYELKLHGIEIKVSKNDLLKDEKMSEYTDYCDYFWLAIPEELLEYAQSVILDGWGIIIIKGKEMKPEVYQGAKKQEALFRQESLTTALLKLL